MSTNEPKGRDGAAKRKAAERDAPADAASLHRQLVEWAWHTCGHRRETFSDWANPEEAWKSAREGQELHYKTAAKPWNPVAEPRLAHAQLVALKDACSGFVRVVGACHVSGIGFGKLVHRERVTEAGELLQRLMRDVEIMEHNWGPSLATRGRGKEGFEALKMLIITLTERDYPSKAYNKDDVDSLAAAAVIAGLVSVQDLRKASRPRDGRARATLTDVKEVPRKRVRLALKSMGRIVTGK